MIRVSCVPEKFLKMEVELSEEGVKAFKALLKRVDKLELSEGERKIVQQCLAAFPDRLNTVDYEIKMKTYDGIDAYRGGATYVGK